jgi:hypothetical protein
MPTFVTNYPDGADAEQQMPSTSERHFGSNFSFILDLPSGWPTIGAAIPSIRTSRNRMPNMVPGAERRQSDRVLLHAC